MPEPSGALALAGLKRYIAHHNLQGSGKKFACVISGANMNFSRLRFVAERAEVGDGKEVLMMVEVPETPGSFMKLHSHIHPRSVTEFSYRYNGEAVSADGTPVAHIYLSFLLNGQAGPSSSVPVPSTAASATAGIPLDGSHAGHLTTAPNFATNALAAHLASATSLGPNGHQSTGSGDFSHLHHVNPPLQNGSDLHSAQRTDPASNPPPPPPAASAPRTVRDLELAGIMDALAADGMRATDISGNEMAKSHARYLVGGRQKVPNERLFRFGKSSPVPQPRITLSQLC